MEGYADDGKEVRQYSPDHRTLRKIPRHFIAKRGAPVRASASASGPHLEERTHDRSRHLS